MTNQLLDDPIFCSALAVMFVSILVLDALSHLH